MTQASTKGAFGRVPLTANVEELAAALFLRHCGAVMETVAQRYATVGTPGSAEAARQVRQAIAQMREIDRLRNLARAQAGSGSGTSEPPLAPVSAVSEVPPRTRLTVERVAERLDVSASFVTRLCRNERLSAIRLGRAWSIDEESVADFEAQRRQI